MLLCHCCLLLFLLALPQDLARAMHSTDLSPSTDDGCNDGLDHRLRLLCQELLQRLLGVQMRPLVEVLP